MTVSVERLRITVFIELSDRVESGVDYLERSVSSWQSSGTGKLCIVEKWRTSGPWINWMDPIGLLGSFR